MVHTKISFCKKSITFFPTEKGDSIKVCSYLNEEHFGIITSIYICIYYIYILLKREKNCCMYLSFSLFFAVIFFRLISMRNKCMPTAGCSLIYFIWKPQNY